MVFHGTSQDGGTGKAGSEVDRLLSECMRLHVVGSCRVMSPLSRPLP
jgi:hypothetical protein